MRELRTSVRDVCDGCRIMNGGNLANLARQNGGLAGELKVVFEIGGGQ